MRLLMITAGAGGMYCGSCLRDNALASELMSRGHDVALLPIYTPTLTDEENVSDGHVFFGGISVYLEQNFPLFRHTPWILDKIWDSGPVLRAFTGGSVGGTNPKLLGELTVSTLRGEAGFQAKEIAKLVHWIRHERPFDVIVLPNSLLVGLAEPLARVSGRPIVCTLQGEDLFIEQLPDPYRAETKRLIAQQAKHVDRFLAVSDYYASFMAEYLELPSERVETVPLGITLSGHAPVASAPERPFTVGYFARVAPEKGLHVLAAAYQILRAELGLEEGRLEVAGYMGEESRGYLAEIEAKLGAAGLGGEFRYHGTLDRAEKIHFLQGLDVVSVPSPYVEPKGLYLLEALANGVPFVQPAHGAFPEIQERTGGGVLTEPGDTQQLAEALLGLARDPERRRELGRRGAAAVQERFGVARMAERTEALLSALAAGAPGASVPAPNQVGHGEQPSPLQGERVG